MPDPRRRSRLDHAVALKKKRELGEALHLLEGLVAEDASDVYAQGHLAHTLLLKGHAREALEMVEHCLAGDPGNAFLHYVRGDALHKLRRWPEAASSLEAAAAGGFASPYVFSRLADAKGRARDPEGQRKALEKGLALFPEDGNLLLALGRLERAAGEGEAAARHIEQAASKLKGDPFAYKELVATRARGRGPEAAEELRRLLRIPSQANNPHLHDELGRLLAEAGDARGAAAAARTAHELEPRNRRFHQRHAFALVREGKDAEAAAELEACLDGEPEDPSLNRSYIAARRRLGQLDEAHAFYLKLLQRHPEAKKVFGWLRRVARQAEDEAE